MFPSVVAAHLLKPITMLCSLHQCVKACTACVFLCLVLGVHRHSCDEHGYNDNNGRVKTRFKRDDALPQDQFLREIFNKYGDQGVITFEGFEHLLESLGLGHLHFADHSLTDHFNDGHFDELHDESHDHYNYPDLGSGAEGHDGHTGHGHDHDSHGDHDAHDHGTQDHTGHDHSDHGGHDAHQGHGGHDAHQGHGGHDAHQGHGAETAGDDGDMDEDYDLFDLFNSEYDSEYLGYDDTEGGDHEHAHTHQNVSGNHDDHSTHAMSHDHQMKDVPSADQHIFTNDEDVSSGIHSLPETELDEHNGEPDGSGHEAVTDQASSHHASKRDVSHSLSRRSSPVIPAIDSSSKSTQSDDDLPRAFIPPPRQNRIPSLNRENGFTDLKRNILDPDHESKTSSVSELLPSIPDVYSEDTGVVRPDLVRYRKKRNAAQIQKGAVGPRSQTTSELDIHRRSVMPDVTKCLSVSDILTLYKIDASQGLTEADLISLCPALIVQIDSKTCITASNIPNSTHLTHGHNHDSMATHGDHDHDHSNHSEVKGEEIKFLDVPLHIWGYAFLSVLVISLVGLLGVAMVPAMQKVFYNHLLQFLVALAVGSLTGDAILHLLPHAILPHDTHDLSDSHGSHGHGTSHQGDEHQDHKHGVWVGLTALGGIYFFFMTERLMGMFMEWKKNSKRKKKTGKLFPVEESETANIGAKLSKHDDRMTSCEEIMMMVHPHNRDVQSLADNAHNDGHPNCESMEDKNASNHTNLMTQHGHSHHGHTHGELPKTIAAVAWMVIMGDGLHNFSDGLAIGAAFADSLTGGLSTSVAVFCHELPHELGDFAVLLRAGMSVKQAMVYNMVSSVLCLFGMIVGVCAGNVEYASSWIFALAAGMFLYISLVDMIPEMTAMDPKKGENPLVHLVLQNFGMITGAAIMLLIAIYEEDIVVPFDAP